MSLALTRPQLFALQAQLATEPASPPVWAPRVRGALCRLDLYFDHRLCTELADLLDEDWLVDTIRVVHGPITRAGLPPLFPEQEVVRAHAARVVLDLDATAPTLRVVDAREPLVLPPGRHLEWLYTRPWFIDAVTDPGLPSLRLSFDDLAAMDSALQRLFQRAIEERTYARR